jgi:hypothetical protein
MNTPLYNPSLKALFFFILLLMITGITSCGSYRKVIKEPLRTHGTDYLIEQMKEHAIQTEYFTARFSAEFVRNQEKMSFSGQMRMKKDSIIWMSISPALGIEMGRLIITNDSIKWLNRLESNFLLTKTQQLAGMIHPLIDYDLLQSLILGNDLTLYDNSQFRGSIDSREYKLSVTQRRNLKKQFRGDESGESIPMQHIWLDPETFRLTKVAIRDLQDKNISIDVEYHRFVELKGFLFASRQQYEIHGSDNKLILNISFNRPNTPETSSFPFTIPEKFISLRD